MQILGDRGVRFQLVLELKHHKNYWKAFKYLIKLGKNNMVILLKTIRNLFIAIFSSGWIIPLRFGIDSLFHYIHLLSNHSQEDLAMKSKTMFVYNKMSSGLIGTGLLWFGIVIAFWVFVAANKLWPVKKTE